VKKSKGKRVTKAMIEAQSELIEEIAKRRGLTPKRILYEAVQSYTWAYIQERGKVLKGRAK
jgi:hypothetical protein